MSNMIQAVPRVSNGAPTKRVEFGLRLLTTILITSAAALVLLQLSVRFGWPTDDFVALTF
jgi:hypothetical protein